jgi:hypothetical protein
VAYFLLSLDSLRWKPTEEKDMKWFKQTLIVMIGLAVLPTLALGDDSATPVATRSAGNQLMEGHVQWYEKPAITVGPVEGVAAQGGTLLTLQPGSFLYMEGNSTLHKYQMTAKTLEGSAAVEAPASENLLKALQTGKVKAMALVIPLKTFNSKDSGLDKNAYKALKAEDNSEIKFELTDETLTAGTAPESYVMTAHGTVTVAGESAPVTLMADATFKDNQVRLKGVQELKMTDFKVTPPTMTIVIISVTCTDEIEIHYDVTFAAKNP